MADYEKSLSPEQRRELVDKTRALKKQLGKTEDFEKMSQLQLPKLTDLDPVTNTSPDQVYIIDNPPVNFFASTNSTVVVHFSLEIPFFKYSDLGYLHKLKQALLEYKGGFIFGESHGYTISRFNFKIETMPSNINEILSKLRRKLYFNYTELLSKRPLWF